jgi:hypothetical protein
MYEKKTFSIHNFLYIFQDLLYGITFHPQGDQSPTIRSLSRVIAAALDGVIDRLRVILKDEEMYGDGLLWITIADKRIKVMLTVLGRILFFY